jgi:hypothetical protein
MARCNRINLNMIDVPVPLTPASAQGCTGQQTRTNVMNRIVTNEGFFTSPQQGYE